MVIQRLTVKNDGWVPIPLSEAEIAGDIGEAPEAIRIRGFRFEKRGSHSIRLASGERCVIESREQHHKTTAKDLHPPNCCAVW